MTEKEYFNLVHSFTVTRGKMNHMSGWKEKGIQRKRSYCQCFKSNIL